MHFSVLCQCGRLGVAVGLGHLILSSALLGAGPASEGVRLEPIEFEAAGGEVVAAELGRFVVPENRQSDSSQQIELAFIRFPSTSPDPGSPIVYLAGGPGGSGTGAARYSRFPLFQSLREIADVIAFDQRGTGMSHTPEPEECEVSRPSPTDRPLDHATLAEMELDAARECAELWRDQGVDLAGYTTLESADDLKALQEVLGAESLTLWAISYGTHLALATIRRHPEIVDRAILAGVEGPDHTVKMPSLAERQLASLLALIHRDPEARERHPDFRTAMESLLERLDGGPATLEFVPPEGGATRRVLVGRPELERLTLAMFRDPSTLVALPALYERLASGDLSPLGRGPSEEFEMEAMEEAMDAASGMSEARRRRFLREADRTLLGGGTQLVGAQMAEALGIPDLGEAFRAPVISEVPVLLISGTLDGRTPVENAEEVLPGFLHASHLMIENAGHSDDLFLSSPLIEDRMKAFLRGEPLPAREHLRVPPPAFDAIRRGIPLPARVTERYLGEYRAADGEPWRVVPLGTYRTLDATGRVMAEDSRIQLRFGGNGYSLIGVAESTFYIPLPGWEHLDVRFVTGEKGEVLALEFGDPEGEVRTLPRLRAELGPIPATLRGRAAAPAGPSTRFARSGGPQRPAASSGICQREAVPSPTQILPRGQRTPRPPRLPSPLQRGWASGDGGL